MPLPAHFLIHTATVVAPAEVTDAWGQTTLDYGPSATRTTITGWFQQTSDDEKFPEGRDTREQHDVFYTNHSGITALDRVETDEPSVTAAYGGGTVTFEVHGPPDPQHRPTGLHHWQVPLRVFEG